MALAPASHVPSIASVSIARVASAPQVKEKQVWVSGCTRTACLFCGKVLSVEGGERHNASAGFSARFAVFELPFVAPVRVVGALPTAGAWHIASPCCLQVGQKQNKLMG